MKEKKYRVMTQKDVEKFMNDLLIENESGQCIDCLFYENNGFCSHNNSKDTCADRDSDTWCDIKSFKKRKLNER